MHMGCILLCSYFGLYCYGLLANTLQNSKRPGEQSEFCDKIKAQVRVFSRDSDVNVLEELRNLKHYLNYRIDKRKYDEQIAAAKVNFEGFRQSHVDDTLRKFDRAVKEKEEESKWKWSPLYQLFKKWPLKNFRAGPWDHSEQEWVEISVVLLENTKSDNLSLERECPHILRAFLQLVRNMEGFRRPLSHPIKGLHVENILGLARDKIQSGSLTTISQNIPITGWCTFPGIHRAVEHIDALSTDVAALLGDEPTAQIAVVEKIESFIGRIAHRAIADMVRMQREGELADMWFRVDIGEERQAKCDEVCSVIYPPLAVLQLKPWKFCNLALAVLQLTPWQFCNFSLDRT
jgi:hypothetical protein